MNRTASRTPYLAWSLGTITATGALTSIHHIFRLGTGLGLLTAVLAIMLLPPVLIRWFLRGGNRLVLAAYAAVTAYIIAAFGFVDGFLDHGLKALGLQNTTFLPGGDAEVVPTVMSLWSPEASNAFYEGTGVLTSIASFIAAYFLVRLLRSQHRTRCLLRGAA